MKLNNKVILPKYGFIRLCNFSGFFCRLTKSRASRVFEDGCKFSGKGKDALGK